MTIIATNAAGNEKKFPQMNREAADRTFAHLAIHGAKDQIVRLELVDAEGEVVREWRRKR